MAVFLEFLGKHFTLHLKGELYEKTLSRALGLRGTTTYWYAGQGIIWCPDMIEHFLFATTPTDRAIPLDAGCILAPATFESLHDLSRDAVFELIGRNSARLIDQLCEDHLAAIRAAKNVVLHRGDLTRPQFLPEIQFKPLSADFLAVHLLGKTPLTFPD